MKNITEFIGIIKGINFDGVINEREVQYLENWVNKNRNLAYEKKEVELIELMDSILEDKVIDEDERKLMLERSQQLWDELRNSSEKLYELNGIIEGIVCDSEINEKEIYKLKMWIEAYGRDVREHKPSAVLIRMIEDILEDGIVTEEEQSELLEMLQNRIRESQFEVKLEYLCAQVKERKNIGVELIDILDDERVIQEIHRRAEIKLLQRLEWNVRGYLPNSEIIVISLVLIAMLEYDGNYYENVRAIYIKAYSNYSEQKVEGMIRSVLGKFKKASELGDRGRIINVALENAIVPQEYLTGFFEFVYDIYKLNFEYDLSEDLYEDFKFVFEGLRDNIVATGDELAVKVTQKTYKLVASTKKLFLSEDGIDAVIKLSMVIAKIIAKRYWNKDSKVYNPYLKVGFEGWEKHFQKESFTRKERERNVNEIYSKWEPKFMYLNKAVYLNPPVHRVKACYDYKDIVIVVENEENVIYRNENCDIREIIGGYQIKLEKIALNNPIGKLTYKLMAGDEVIFESKKKLYRTYIVFNENGEEISNNTEYEGGAFFCLKPGNYEMERIHNESAYIIGYKIVRFGDVLPIGNDVFNFSTITKAGIWGEKHNNCVLHEDGNNKEFSVYKAVRSLVFEGKGSNPKFEIIINEASYRLSDFKYTNSARGTNVKYVVDLDLIESGIYKIEVIQLIEGKRERVFRETIAYDKELRYFFSNINSNIFEVFVESGLINEHIKAEVSIEKFVPDFIKFKKNEIIYSYLLAFDFGLLNIDNNKWQSNVEGIWIDDVTYNSTLAIYDAECDGVLIYSDNGKILEDEIVVKNKGFYTEMSIGFLTSYKQVNKYILLVFTKNGKKKHTAICYNKCIIAENETEIIHLDKENQIHVTPIYHGKNKVYFEMINQNEELVYKSRYLDSGETEIITACNSFEEYTFDFYEKRKMLMIDKKEILLQRKQKFYCLQDFVGRIFKIKEVYYNKFIRDNLIEKNHYFNKTFLRIEDLIIDKDMLSAKFVGELFVKTYQGSWPLSNINPVEVEVCSDIIDDTMDIFITNDGDGLLLDFEHHGIMNVLDHPTAPDIFLYTIDVESEVLL